jgi:hypothetical protein
MKRFIAAASATETPFARSYQIVACPKCHASLRVPGRASANPGTNSIHIV